MFDIYIYVLKYHRLDVLRTIWMTPQGPLAGDSDVQCALLEFDLAGQVGTPDEKLRSLLYNVLNSRL